VPVCLGNSTCYYYIGTGGTANCATVPITEFSQGTLLNNAISPYIPSLPGISNVEVSVDFTLFPGMHLCRKIKGAVYSCYTLAGEPSCSKRQIFVGLPGPLSACNNFGFETIYNFSDGKNTLCEVILP
jgi:hypothetical protein